MTTDDDTEGMPGPTGTGTRDAQLVTAYLAGDRSALGAIYDRHGASLFDTAAAMTGSRDDAADMVQDVFVLAAERLGQLRDPTRLRPWLFAILRNEVYRRSRRRSRSVVTDFSEPGREIVIPPTPSETERVDDELDAEELAELVRGAARGLDPRDQLVLELSVRQGLTGGDLADALGVSAQQGYGLVHRMRERTERSLGAYCVARRGRRDCDELAGILAGWDGEFTVLVRKRVARHIESCSTCERTRRRFLPLGLVGAAPAFAAPIGLRDRIMEQVLALDSAQASSAGPSEGGSGIDPSTGFPLLDGASRAGRRLLAVVAGTAAVSLIIVGGLTLGGDPPSSDQAASEVGSATSAPAVLADTTTPPSTDARVTDVTLEPTTTIATDAVVTTITDPADAESPGTDPAGTVEQRSSPTVPRVSTPATVSVTTTTAPSTTAAPTTTAPSTTSTAPSTTTPSTTTAPTTTTTLPNAVPMMQTPTACRLGGDGFGGNRFRVDATVSDADGESLTVTASAQPTGGINPAVSVTPGSIAVAGSGTASFEITLTNTDATVTLTVTDSGGASTSRTISIGDTLTYDYCPTS